MANEPTNWRSGPYLDCLLTLALREAACRLDHSPSRSLTVPVRHEIDVDAGLVLVELSGAVTAAEIFAHYAALAADPALRPSLAVLADARQVTSGPSFGELHVVAYARGRLPVALRPTRAAVLVNKGWLFGLARQFAALVDRVGIRVMPFFDVDEAHRWLAVDSELSLTSAASEPVSQPRAR